MVIILIITHIVAVCFGFAIGAIMATGKRADKGYGEGAYGDENRL